MRPGGHSSFEYRARSSISRLWAVGVFGSRLRFRFSRKSAQCCGSTPSGRGNASLARARFTEGALAPEVLVVLDGLSEAASGVDVVRFGGEASAPRNGCAPEVISGLSGLTQYLQPFPAISMRSSNPFATSALMTPWHVRSLLLHLRDRVAIDGHASPSSLAQSASARRTIFSLSGRSSAQTWDMMRTLMGANPSPRACRHPGCTRDKAPARRTCASYRPLGGTRAVARRTT